MRLPFFWVSLGFTLGIILEKYSAFSTGGLILSLGLGLILLSFFRGRGMFLPLFVLMMMGTGFFWARQDLHQPPEAVQKLVGPGRVTLAGVVKSLPETRTRGKKVTVSFILAAHSVTMRENGYRKNIKVSGNVQTFLIQPPFIPEAGDKLRLYGTLELPRRVLNPGEFDYARFLEQKDVYAIFQSIGRRSVRRTAFKQLSWPVQWVAGVRHNLSRLIDKLYPEAEAAIMKALVIGIRTDIAPEVRDQFMKTGTIHLLAISGLNITMIAGSFFLFFLFLQWGHKKAACVTILIVLVYVGIAGAGLPVQRAGYVSVLVLLGTLMGRPVNLLNVLYFAFFSLLLWDPHSLWNVGFQLSFLSVFSLIVILPVATRFNGRAFSLGSSLAVLIGTFPLVIYYFNIFSPVSMLANFAAIPLFDGALFTGLWTLLFSGVPLLNAVLAKLSGLFLGSGLAWVKYLSTWRIGYWFLAKPPLRFLFLYYAGLITFLFLMKRSFRWKKEVIVGTTIFWLAITVSFFIPQNRETFRLTLLSGGKNQMAHVQFSNGAQWLINTGRNFPSDQGEWLVTPYLRSQGIQRLEGVLLTDLYKNHMGGLPAILRDFPVRYLLYPQGAVSLPGIFLRMLRSPRFKAQNIQTGDRVAMGEEEIKVIAQSRSGMVVQIVSFPWRILLISRIDPGLFHQLMAIRDLAEVHAVILPPAGKEFFPADFRDWIMKIQPSLVVLPEAQPGLERILSSEKISILNLRHSGALCFRKNGAILELESFLSGKLGFYAYR